MVCEVATAPLDAWATVTVADALPATALGAAGVPVQWHLSKGLGHGIDPFGLGLAQKFLVDAFSGRAPRTGPVTTPFAR